MARRLKPVPAPFKTWGAYFYFQLSDGRSPSSLAIEHGRMSDADVTHGARQYAEKRGLSIFPGIRRVKGSRVQRVREAI